VAKVENNNNNYTVNVFGTRDRKLNKIGPLALEHANLLHNTHKRLEVFIQMTFLINL
jgi:hypothetical protein